MGFSSHPVVQEYMQELEKITMVRDGVREKLIATREMIMRADNPTEVHLFTKQAQDLEKEISLLTTQGQDFMKKIDKLNGVR